MTDRIHALQVGAPDPELRNTTEACGCRKDPAIQIIPKYGSTHTQTQVTLYPFGVRRHSRTSTHLIGF
jgi:hypothetical protein